jgi:hypothetical protein
MAGSLITSAISASVKISAVRCLMIASTSAAVLTIGAPMYVSNRR